MAQLQQAQYQIKGISQDLVNHLFSPQYAFEMHNIRINADDENSLLCLTNEKGNSIVTLGGESLFSYGTIIGIGEFSTYVILFLTDYKENGEDEATDAIFYYDPTANTLQKLLTKDLNFDSNHLIQTICVYENKDVQKVYWIDGKNPLRVINVAPDIYNLAGYHKVNEQLIDILPELQMNEQVSISKSSGGVMPSGVIQYAFTYSDKKLQESNIWYVSPLYYIANSDSGADAESRCNIAFKIEFSGLDTRFDFVQIYAFVRTSLNATPSCYRVANVSTQATLFIDNGSAWETVSPIDVLRKQSDSFIPQTMASKDNTLFLGNYHTDNFYIDATKPEALSNRGYFYEALSSSIKFVFTDSYKDAEDSYSLDKGHRGVSTFRTGEWYRFGIQFQNKNGAVSNVFPLTDLQPDVASPTMGTFAQKIVEAVLPSEPDGIPNVDFSAFYNKGYKARLVMANRENLPRRSVCQGLLCPTVFRLNDRVNNSPFAMSSWCMRGQEGGDSAAPTWKSNTSLKNHLSAGGEIQNQIEDDAVLDLQVIQNSNLILIEGGTEEDSSVETTYYYLVSVTYTTLEGMDQATPYKGVVYLSLGRTTDPSVKFATNKKCTRYIYKLKYELGGFPEDTTGEEVNNTLKAWVYNKLVSALERSGLTTSQATATAGYFTSEDVWHVPTEWNAPKTISYMVGNSNGSAKTNVLLSTSFDNAATIAKGRLNQFYCDHNILTFHSPDVEAQQQLIDNNPNLKYRIIGYTEIDKSFFDYQIVNSTGTKTATTDSSSGLQTVTKESQLGIYNSPLWKDENLFPIYTWHHALSLGPEVNADDKQRWYNQYTKKIFANVHYCTESRAFTNSDSIKYYEPSSDLDIKKIPFPEMGTPRVFNSDEVTALSLNVQKDSGVPFSSLMYYGNVNLAHSIGSYKVPTIVNDEIFIDDNSTVISDACLIQYKSTPHVVMPMSYFTYGERRVAPVLPTGEYYGANWREQKFLAFTQTDSLVGYIWGKQVHGFLESYVLPDDNPFWPEDCSGLVYIAELYQDLTATDIYGAYDEESLAKLTWNPIGDWVPVERGNKLIGYGDTFIGRWECLKTYAYSDDSKQSYIDITSVILESDINLDSRYDKLKGTHNGTVVTERNFNLFNSVYNQRDNLFSYFYTRPYDNIKEFQNQICWSGVKVNGEEIDSWCNINPLNSIDLQGEYGQLSSIMNFNNDLYCFQPNAVSRVNYNSRVMISPSDNNPIQLSSNYSVEPPLIIGTGVGASDKRVVKCTNSALYFYDSLRKRIFALGAKGELNNLSEAKGMNSFLNKNQEVTEINWDAAVSDVYFNFEDKTLAFNESLKEFTSLYDYNKAKFMFNIGRRAFAIESHNLWEQRTGDYCGFFGDKYPFSIDLLVNPEALVSKTFNTVEYKMKADLIEGGTTTDKHKTFDIIKANTEYQEGEIVMNNPNNQASIFLNSLLNPKLFDTRKFRIWRMNIPREAGTINRMRDNWIRLKFKKNPEEDNVRYRINGFSVCYTK